MLLTAQLRRAGVSCARTAVCLLFYRVNCLCSGLLNLQVQVEGRLQDLVGTAGVSMEVTSDMLMIHLAHGVHGVVMDMGMNTTEDIH